MRCVALRVVPLLMEPGALANDRTSSIEKLDRQEPRRSQSAVRRGIFIDWANQPIQAP